MAPNKIVQYQLVLRGDVCVGFSVTRRRAVPNVHGHQLVHVSYKTSPYWITMMRQMFYAEKTENIYDVLLTCRLEE